jgi:peptidoglycan/xylan/chitin deacetylase (PgdA/CDA1 family)
MNLLKWTLAASCFLAPLTPGLAEADNQLRNLSGIPLAERSPAPVEWPAAEGEAAVCLWKDDKRAALSFTIDDNSAPDVDWWLEQSKQRGIRLTWFLVTSGIGKTSFNGDWELWKRVMDAGHDLQSHTMTHLSASKTPETWKGIDWEYEESKKMLEENLPGLKVSTLAYPGGGQSHVNSPEAAGKYYISARGTKGMLNGSRGLNCLSINAMSKSNYGEGGIWANLNGLLDQEINGGKGYRGWAVHIFHLVKDKEAAIVDLDFASNNKDKIWTGAYTDVAKYAQERETATVTTRKDGSRLFLTLTDRMDDTLFDHPLTVKLRMPAPWKGLTATQGGRALPARGIRHEDVSYALIEVVPDRGEVEVKGQ